MLFIVSELGSIQCVKKTYFQVLKWYVGKVKKETISEYVFGFKMTLIYTVTVINEDGEIIKEFQISNKAV